MSLKLKIVEEKPFYDFFQDGVTQSILAKWLRCPRQAYLEYVQGWTAYQSSDPIVFGNVVHYVLDKVYANHQLPTSSAIVAYIRDFEQINYDDNTPLNVQEKLEVIFAKAEAVLISYFRFYYKDFEYNWLFTEETFKIKYHFGNGSFPSESKKTTYLRGKIDGGLETGENGKNLWLIDHKCKGQINLDNLLTLLPTDLQINFYLVAFNQTFHRTPKGFIYNIIRNPQSKPLFSKNESLEDYIVRITNKIAENPEHYFQRIKIPTTDAEIQNWSRNQLRPILQDMYKWVESNYTWPAYYDPTALENRYGLSSMAAAIVENDFTDLYQRKTVFQELC